MSIVSKAVRTFSPINLPGKKTVCSLLIMVGKTFFSLKEMHLAIQFIILHIRIDIGLQLIKYIGSLPFSGIR